MIDDVATWVGSLDRTQLLGTWQARLKVAWLNEDGSAGDGAVIALQIYMHHGDPPTLTGGTVGDGDKDADSKMLNKNGIEIEFSESVAKVSLKLLSDDGTDVGWILKVDDNTVRFEPVEGKELKANQIYLIAGDVEDAAGNKAAVDITFITQ